MVKEMMFLEALTNERRYRRSCLILSRSVQPVPLGAVLWRAFPRARKARRSVPKPARASANKPTFTRAAQDAGMFAHILFNTLDEYTST